MTSPFPEINQNAIEAKVLSLKMQSDKGEDEAKQVILDFGTKAKQIVT